MFLCIEYPLTFSLLLLSINIPKIINTYTMFLCIEYPLTFSYSVYHLIFRDVRKGLGLFCCLKLNIKSTLASTNSYFSMTHGRKILVTNVIRFCNFLPHPCSCFSPEKD